METPPRKRTVAAVQDHITLVAVVVRPTEILKTDTCTVQISDSISHTACTCQIIEQSVFDRCSRYKQTVVYRR